MSQTLSRPFALRTPSLATAVTVDAAPRTERWTIETVDDTVAIVRGVDAAEPVPAGWRRRLVDALRSLPGVVAVGAKRLREDGSLFSMGEMVVHPKGFHHLGQGLDGRAFRFVEEVDAICGGVLAVDAEALRAWGGPGRLEREAADPLALVALCLELRLAGGRIISVPDVTVRDTFSPRPEAAERAAFRRRLGFDCLAADLDQVRSSASRRGLLWNVRFHHPPLAFEKYDHRPGMHWRAYDDSEPYRRRADHLARIAPQSTPCGRVLDLGCGDGLFSHLVGLTGLEVVGVDPHEGAVRQAEAAVARRPYPGPRPAFTVAGGEALPFPDRHFRVVMMYDVIEHLP
ncbi:MAG: class I SAM-dependent methyltransferase, partial [Planctomycetota bacterium]